MNPLIVDKIEELLVSIANGDPQRLGRFLKELFDTEPKDLEDFFQGLTGLLVENAGELLGCDLWESDPATARQLGEQAISQFGDLKNIPLLTDKLDLQECAGSLLATMTGADESKTLGDLDPVSLMLLLALTLLGLFGLQDDS